MARARDGHHGDDLFAAAPLPVARLDAAQRLACLRLIRSENVGPATFRALINHYGGAAPALAALPELGRRGGKRSIRVCPTSEAEAELEAAAGAGVNIVFTIEPGYPEALAWTERAPPMLYTKGRSKLLGRRLVAIVGARQASALGQKFAGQLATEIGAAGFVIASGLARGVDAAAHRAALRSGTVAVVAGGIDVVYPPEHAELQQQIAEHGCLVSEQPMGFQPRGQDFPRRNRIISGISLGVVVVEAARRSGSLLTARLAAEQGRDVFAVPGHPLDPRAEGTNALLKDGATPVTSGADVVAALKHGRPETPDGPFREADAGESGCAVTAAARGGPDTSASAPPSQVALSDTDRSCVLAALSPAPVTIDDLATTVRIPIREVQVALIELALAGRLIFHGQQRVSLR